LQAQNESDKPWIQHRTKLVTKTKTFSNGDKYTGQFNSKGLQHGKGVYEFVNGDIYDGDFVNGKFEGKGKFTSAEGDIYEGEFKSDLYHGKGVAMDANGDKYEGNFDKGERSGYG